MDPTEALRKAEPGAFLDGDLHLTPKAERMTRRLETLAGQLREDYLTGVPAVRREALIADLVRIKTNLLHMEVRGKQRPDEN